MKDKKTFRNFINTVITIYGVLSFDELYRINQYFKYRFSKKALYDFCLSEINHIDSEIEYLFAGIEFSKYVISFFKDNDLLIRERNIDIDDAIKLLDFKYPINYEYMFNKNDLHLVAERRTEDSYNDIVPYMICDLYDSLDQHEVNALIDYIGIEKYKEKELKTIICRIIYRDLFMNLNLEFASLINEITIDEFIKDKIMNFHDEILTIESTIIALIPYKKSEELLHTNFSLVRRHILRGYSIQEINILEELDSLFLGKEHLLNNISISDRLFYMSIELDDELVDKFIFDQDEESRNNFTSFISIIRDRD